MEVLVIVAGLVFVGYVLLLVFSRKKVDPEVARQARKERFLKTIRQQPSYVVNPEAEAEYRRRAWEKEVEQERKETEIEIAKRVFADEVYVLAVAKKVGMHKTVDQVGLVSEWVQDVVTFAHEKLDDRLTVKPLYSQFKDSDTIPPKLRARRFYNALGAALGSAGLAERPSKKQGWRLSDKGREEWGFNYHV